jgi:hypothetical protein
MHPRHWDVFIAGCQARLPNGSGLQADVTIESFILLVFGRLSASDARVAGLMTVSGNETRTGMLDQWFRGV